MDSDRTDKQQYLFQEIIQKNYDPEQFQEYIFKAKPNGEDLDNWSLSELKSIVTEFQRICNKEGDKDKEPNLQAEKRKNQLDLESKVLLEDYLEEE